MNRAHLAAIATLLVGGAAAPADPVTFATDRGPVRLGEAEVGELARRTVWRSGSGGLEWAELRLHGRGEARRTRVVAVRLDPRRFDLSLQNGMAPGGYLRVWTLDRAPGEAALAFNAGMFENDGAWGWVVHGGKEYRPPRRGPLAAALIVDSTGAVRLVDDAEVERIRATGMGGVREAFQSFPVLLRDGELPEMLRVPGAEIRLEHRDARLAVGVDQDGNLIVALTRFDALGPSLGSVPFGLTLPEMALVMRGLGATLAMGLDGGVSAQLLLRDPTGAAHRWDGLREVPLGFAATPKCSQVSARTGELPSCR